MQYAIIIVLVAFALMFGIRRLRSARRGEPADDELSLKVLHRAAMISYLVSLNVWAILIYIGSITKVDPFIVFGTGILSMVVVFAVSWVIIKTRRYA